MIFWLSLGVENLVEMPIKCAPYYDPRLTRNFIALASHWFDKLKELITNDILVKFFYFLLKAS